SARSASRARTSARSRFRTMAGRARAIPALAPRASRETRRARLHRAAPTAGLSSAKGGVYSPNARELREKELAMSLILLILLILILVGGLPTWGYHGYG